MLKRSIEAVCRATIALAIVWVAACAAPSNVPSQAGTGAAAAANSSQSPDASAPKAEFRLGSGDKIHVIVFNADKLSGDYDIDLSGSIVMPLIGVVPAAGVVPTDLADTIAKRLKDQHFMDDPQVSIQVISTRPFYVLGEVQKPGEYPYRAGLTINSAVATAGGFTFRAEQDYIYILRYGEGTETKIKMSPSIPIFPGDIVRVDNRFF